MGNPTPHLFYFTIRAFGQWQRGDSPAGQPVTPHSLTPVRVLTVAGAAGAKANSSFKQCHAED